MPEQGDWQAVRNAIRVRMRHLEMDDLDLSQKTRLAPGTLNSIFAEKGTSNKSTLVAISAVLGWPYDYLINILHEESSKNSTDESPAEYAFKQAVWPRLRALNDEVARLNNIFSDASQENRQISDADAQHVLDDQ